MDYLPPHKPISTAKADHALLAEYHQHTYKFIDIGKMSQMLDPGDWKSPIDLDLDHRDAIRKKGIKPGQRVVFAQPDTAPTPFFYVTEHKPCSPATYKSFTQLIARDVFELDGKQLQSLSEILQERANPKTYYPLAGVSTIGGREGISIFFDRRTKDKHYLSRAFFFVSNPKKRIIEEYGYEGAPGHNHWHKEADTMFESVEFEPPGK
jgi:hypothetical protein